MRLFESLLLVITALLVFRSVSGTKFNWRVKPFIALMILVTVAHLIVEGARWQMYPAYLTSLIIILLEKLNKLYLSRKSKVAVWLFWFALTVFLPVAVPVIDLPVPEGPFSIGTSIFNWTDSSRAEWFTPENDHDFRELVVQIWYPAEKSLKEPDPYFDHMDIRSQAIGSAGDIPGFLVSHLDLVKTHSYHNAIPLVQSERFPILIFSHGITGNRQMHTALIEELTSNGYFVVAPDHTYDCNLTVFPDGRTADYRSEISGHPDSVAIRRQQLETRVADLRFIINQLENLRLKNDPLVHALDFNKIGVLGHSFGGATAIQTAYKDQRIKAVAALDSWANPLPDSIINNGIQKPFLYLGRPDWSRSEYPSSPDLLTQLVQNCRGTVFHLTLKHSEHLDFTDVPLFSPFARFFLDTGRIPADRAVAVTNNLVTAFFDRFIKNMDNQFQDQIALFSEVTDHTLAQQK